MREHGLRTSHEDVAITTARYQCSTALEKRQELIYFYGGYDMKKKITAMMMSLVLSVPVLAPINVYASQTTVVSDGIDSTVFMVDEGAYLHASVTCTPIVLGLKACSWYAALTGSLAFAQSERCSASFGKNGSYENVMSKSTFKANYSSSGVRDFEKNSNSSVSSINATVYY